MSQVSLRNDTIRIESPFPLSVPALETIQKMIGVIGVETKVTINKSILAGFKARYKGILYDGSAERIIKEITNQ